MEEVDGGRYRIGRARGDCFTPLRNLLIGCLAEGGRGLRSTFGFFKSGRAEDLRRELFVTAGAAMAAADLVGRDSEIADCWTLVVADKRDGLLAVASGA